MKLLKAGRLIDDPWRRLADDEALRANSPAIVSLARLKSGEPNLVGRAAGLGAALRNDEPVEHLRPFLAALDVVCLAFPKFTDGRAYSQARILRERLHYGGELRATGQVLIDQLLFMRRCGFDAFEIERPDAEARWRAALAHFSAFYQPAGDDGAPISLLRRRLAQPDAA